MQLEIVLEIVIFKTNQNVGFLERDFERDHLADKSYWTKMGPKMSAIDDSLPILHVNR
jgi:hypothetical protein